MPTTGQFILRPGQPGEYVPGQVPENLPLPGSDDDMKTGKTRTSDDRLSPKKPRVDSRGAGSSLDLETFKGLLAEQAAQINETQRHALAELMSGLRKDLETHKEEIRQEVKTAEKKVTVVESQVANLMDRVAKLEGGAPNGGVSVPGLDDRHRYTLVYGGWPRESARKDILASLDAALHRLDLIKGMVDSSPFCTGPRRSLALQSFSVRPGENYVGMRSRMSVVIATIANSTVGLGDGDSKLWASYSRTREQRTNGDHAAWVRRTVRKIAPMQEDWLEVEYSAGGVWLRGHKIASAVDHKPKDVALESLLLNPDKGDRLWVNAGLMAEILDTTVAAVKKAADEVRR